MILTSLRNLLSRPDVQTLFITTAIGGILQIMCRQYIKNHPELFHEKSGKPKVKEAEPGIENKDRNPRFRGFFRRGGATVTIDFANIGPIIKFLSEIGLLGGLFAGTGNMIVTNISKTAISTYLRDAMPQSLYCVGKESFTLVNVGKKLYLDQCDQSLEYLVRILNDKTLPFEEKEKEKVTHSILTKYLNLKTETGRLNFVLCIFFILSLFSAQDMASYHIILKNLIKALKEGRISKVVARAIVRRLQKKGLPVDPELLDVINS